MDNTQARWFQNVSNVAPDPWNSLPQCGSLKSKDWCEGTPTGSEVFIPQSGVIHYICHFKPTEDNVSATVNPRVISVKTNSNL